MAPETDHAIDKGNVYEDKSSFDVQFVVIKGFYVDEAGRTQIKVSQFTDKPIAAHNSAGYLTGVSGRRTLELNDIRDRILKGELVFDGKE